MKKYTKLHHHHLPWILIMIGPQRCYLYKTDILLLLLLGICIFTRRSFRARTEIPDIYIGWPFPNILTSVEPSIIYLLPSFLHFLHFIFCRFFSFFLLHYRRGTPLFINPTNPSIHARRFPIYFTINFKEPTQS